VVKLAVALLKGHAMLAQFTSHMVEIVSEDGKLVMRLDGNGVREIPLCHCDCPLSQFP
jgi:hypothetical protein